MTTARKTGKPAWLGWIRLAVSLVTIAIVLAIVDVRSVLGALSRVGPVLWASVLGIYLVGHVTSAYKWRILAAPDAPFVIALRAHFNGLAANIALPGAASGDIVRAGVMAASASDRARLAVGSLADRLIDTVGLFLLAALGVVAQGKGTSLELLWYIGGALVLVPLSVVLARPVLTFLAKRVSGEGKLPALVRKLLEAGLVLSQNSFQLVLCLLLSLGVQSAFILASAELGRAAGVTSRISDWFVAWPLSKLVATIPTSAGGLGVREASLAGLLSQFGADPAKVFASGLVWQSVIIIGALIGVMLVTLITFRRGGKTSAPATDTRRAEKEFHAMPLAHGNPSKPRIAVLGAGPAGLSAAYYLHRAGKAEVDVFEASGDIGGAASGLDIEGVHCDLGSHRFHPAAEPDILDDVKGLLGDDLLWRPRHGRIRLQRRWIHFPLKPLDFLVNAPKTFVASIGLDSIKKLFPRAKPAHDNFATVLERGLGQTICRSFYFPYAIKLWGVDPTKLDATAAHRRVSGSSIGKMIGKVLSQVPGFKKPKAGGFYYPRLGFRQISDATKSASERLGARYYLRHRITDITPNATGGFQLGVDTTEGRITRDYDYVWSSIPLTVLASSLSTEKPQAVKNAIGQVRYRSMILVYLVLEQQQFTEFDAHYFPEIDVPLSRLSEPKNYYASQTPQGVTVLCGELPCSTTDEYWRMSDEDLGRLMVVWLNQAGLPVKSKVRKVQTRRLSHAYPIYDADFGGKLDALEEWIGEVDGLVTFGRQGLFAHDNTHHAFAMAKAASECLNQDGSWDRTAWAQAREHFREHVVED